MTRTERESRSRSRSRSPEREHKRRRRHSRAPRSPTAPRPLPLNARGLTRHDLRTHRPMFALYLDIQKQIDIDELEEAEVKGRWKSFVNKWNRGELAQGWYDPTTLTKAIDADQAQADSRRSPANPPASTQTQNHSSDPLPPRPVVEGNDNDNTDDDDDFGPALPSQTTLTNPSNPHGGRLNGSRAPGPANPTLDDIHAHHESLATATAHERTQAHTALSQSRKSERALQDQRLNELAPRAEPGTRERQLEKRREAAASNRAFATSAHEAGDAELRDADVMGEADSLGEMKRLKKEHERKKNERELRREEVLRARRAEREARLAVVREKEERTVGMLKELARARFGGGETAGEEGG